MLTTTTYLAAAHLSKRAVCTTPWIRLQSARRWLRRVSLPWVLFPYYQLRGRLEAELKLPGAAETLDKAVRLTESMRSEIPAEDLRISFFQDKLAAFHSLIGIGLKKDTARSRESAFLYSERARSQVLLDLLDGSLHFRGEESGAMKLFAETRIPSKRILAPDYRRLAQFFRCRARTPIGTEIVALDATVAISSPGAEEREPLTLKAVQDALAPDQSLISYYVIDDAVHAFVLDRNGLSTHPSLVRLSSLLPRWQFLRFQLERARIDPAASAEASHAHLQQLYDALLLPLASRLENSAPVDNHSARPSARVSVSLPSRFAGIPRGSPLVLLYSKRIRLPSLPANGLKQARCFVARAFG